MDLFGKVAIVAGAASGIGRSVALACSAVGARVVIPDLQEEEALETVDLNQKGGGESFFLKADASSAVEIEAGWEQPFKLMLDCMQFDPIRWKRYSVAQDFEADLQLSTIVKILSGAGVLAKDQIRRPSGCDSATAIAMQRSSKKPLWSFAGSNLSRQPVSAGLNIWMKKRISITNEIGAE